MANYSIEDIELIRRKSGISYQEAVALLDYHNGNVARALIDLERNGRIHPENAGSGSASREKGRFSRFMTRLYQFRLKVRKGDAVILNFSLIFAIISVLVSPRLVLIGLALMLILGYRVSFDKKDGDFAADNLENMVRNAAQNVKDSVTGMAREFTGDGHEDHASSDRRDPPAQDGRSFYQANPAATTYHAAYGGSDASAPVLQVPVQAETSDGSVKVESDKDGYGNATVE